MNARESTVMGLLRKAEARSLEARIAEIKAVRNSMHDGLSRLDARLEANSERLIRGNEPLIRANAYPAFVGSGGAPEDSTACRGLAGQG